MMTALLELPALRERVYGLSVESYHRLGELGMLSEDVELLHGIVVTKMSKSPLHELVAQKLMLLLLAKIPVGFQVRPERPLTLRDSEPEPDISMVRGKPEDWANAHPSTAELVVEVAVSSAAIDEGKAAIYAEAGNVEYWLIRPEDGEVDVYREPKSARYASKTTLKRTDTLRCLNLPAVEVVVSEIMPAL